MGLGRATWVAISESFGRVGEGLALGAAIFPEPREPTANASLSAPTLCWATEHSCYLGSVLV